MKRLLSIFSFAALLSAPLAWTQTVITLNSVTPPAVATFSTAQAASTYTVLTAATSAVYIKSCTFYSSVVSAGLTSISMQTDDTTAITVLATTNLAALTAGKNLTSYVGPLYLPSGKHITATIVGAGSGSGAVIVSCEYVPTGAGGTLS